MSSRSRLTVVVSVAILVAAGVFVFRTKKKAEVAKTAVAVARPVEKSAEASTTIAPSPPQAETEPAAAAAKPALTDGGRRILGLFLPENLRRPGIASVADVLAQLEQLDESSRGDYFQSVIEFCLTQDRAGTADLLLTLPSEKWRDHGMSFALQRWAEADPRTALRWAAEHPRGENDHTRYHAAYEGFASHQPMEALLALKQSDLAGDADVLSRIVIHHFDDNERLAQARTWIEQLPEGNLRELLVRQMMRSFAKESPTEAANWLASTASDETFRSGMGELLQTLVKDDPSFAAGLTQKFSDPQIREGYLADVVYSWAKRDLGGAAAWLREQPMDAHYDAAIARLVDAIAPNDPNEARQWANRMVDAKKREDVLRRVK